VSASNGIEFPLAEAARSRRRVAAAIAPCCSRAAGFRKGQPLEIGEVTCGRGSISAQGTSNIIEQKI